MDRGENGLTQLGEVKRVLIEFLDKAEETLKAFPQSQIKFSLVDFDTFASVVQDVTLLTLQNIPSIKETINRMVTRNTTNIPAGLALAANKMEEMARVRGAASRTFVFLTDGQNDREMTPHDLQRPQQQLNEASANLFALGMGQGHKAETMQFVIKDHLTGGAGNYPNAIYQWIDGSVAEEMPGKTSLSDAVQNIFLQANGRWMQNLTFESTTSRADVTVLNASKQGDRFLLGGVQFGGTAKKIIEVLSDDKELAFKVRYQVDGKTKEQTVQVELTNVQDRTILLEALKQDLAAIMTRIPRLPLNDQLELIEEAKKMITAFGDEENLKDYAQKFEKWGEDLRNPRTHETTSRSLTSYGGQLMSIVSGF
ncbi:MAG: VWA domain-containing protein, partial [Alphaproteobacteria bacterium]|nr:VWA domain-containing protein [Alphaproteobacteria bacterium]